MKKEFERVYQFKITLNDIRPPIWRRIQVPETYSFWDLHVAIQNAMGWLDCHLHLFEINDPYTGMNENIGLPAEDFEMDDDIHPGWEKKIKHYFSKGNKKTKYVYDFGDDWRHTVVLEKILLMDKNIDYPICIKGKRACPPEDCGGVWGYSDFLEIIQDPKNERYDEMKDWLGVDFDSEFFDAKEVQFDDPAKRWEMVFK